MPHKRTCGSCRGRLMTCPTPRSVHVDPQINRIMGKVWGMHPRRFWAVLLPAARTLGCGWKRSNKTVVKSLGNKQNKQMIQAKKVFKQKHLNKQTKKRKKWKNKISKLTNLLVTATKPRQTSLQTWKKIKRVKANQTSEQAKQKHPWRKKK